MPSNLHQAPKAKHFFELIWLLLSLSVWSQQKKSVEAPVVVGLDHLILAVSDLNGTAERYRQLGFALKAGKPHENGIHNHHLKFSDGSEIELLSVSEARDGLTSEYRQHIDSGDGPAFFGLYTPNRKALMRLLDATGKKYHHSGMLLTFPKQDRLHYTFFGPRNKSASDRPEHFAHPNGAEKLIGVWLADDDFTAERRLFTTLGLPWKEKDIAMPEPLRVQVVQLGEAEIVLLPGSHQLVPGRRIVGATIRTRDLNRLRSHLGKAGLDIPPTRETRSVKSLFLPPDLTHGLWLEFREYP